MTRFTVLAPYVALLGLICGCVQQTAPADTREEDERVIRKLEAEAVEAAAAKDLDRFVSLYADDASCFVANTPIITGKDAIREYWKAIFALPGFKLDLEVLKVEASRSSDLAYTHGQYTLTSNDDMGNPRTDKGKYVVVYRKQPDGQWKVIIDIGNSDSPAQEASTD